MMICNTKTVDVAGWCFCFREEMQNNFVQSFHATASRPGHTHLSTLMRPVCADLVLSCYCGEHD